MKIGRRVHAHPRSAVGIALIVSVVAAGCIHVDEFHGPYVYNYTGTQLTISYVHNQQTTPMGVTVDNGGAGLGLFSGGCSDGTLLALDPAGQVVAQRDTPLCAGDSWEIGTRPSASP